jgi:hypothetical protein
MSDILKFMIKSLDTAIEAEKTGDKKTIAQAKKNLNRNIRVAMDKIPTIKLHATRD